MSGAEADKDSSYLKFIITDNPQLPARFKNPPSKQTARIAKYQKTNLAQKPGSWETFLRHRSFEFFRQTRIFKESQNFLFLNRLFVQEGIFELFNAV